ncbi:hypothetical protein [Clostridium neonatale]|uniref:Uncharacterized protein n=2 Tax=root TaxID=1 RepID=A0AAD2DH15_9CLOT|nr:hypothetical protein [Clostridium neonatale]DAF76163.1 MAG TPA: hypothetical protein [Caudoviricetes sp.]DAF94587.1 MAG TPA: hypothetical protein [Siphoviridae sp. ct3gT1]CAI3202299.1 conserved hypothetical protein [Clostridium neonatale]CAI3223212.1 conserved hypothetical protein [Clostridium neonatale]CAI3246667.1 conserved hypothetical protein [Clostridium neonatale]
MISLARFTQKASAVNTLIQDIVNALPDNEAAESLENNYDELYSMILGIAETLDCTLSDVEK